jgi:hypothetical protein
MLVTDQMRVTRNEVTGMYSDLSGMLAYERISEFHRAADRDRMAREARVARRSRRAGGSQRLVVVRQPKGATA